VVRTNFNFIDEDLKAEWDKKIEERILNPIDIPIIEENPVNKIYDKLTLGKTTSLKEICKLGKIPEKDSKKCIDKLVLEHKLTGSY
jgi:hypothetical protein